MDIGYIVIGIAIFGLVFASAAYLAIDANTIYGTDINASEYGGDYSTLNETYSIATGQKQQLFGDPIDTQDTPNSLVSGGYSAIRLLGGSFSTVGTIVWSLITKYPIPTFFGSVAIIAFVGLVSWGILLLVFRLYSP